MELLEQVLDAALRSGAQQAGWISTADLVPDPAIREICRGNLCRNYGTSWACPPAVGTLEACRKRLQQYDKMLLFAVTYALEDSFDIEGMHHSWAAFKDTVDILQDNLAAFLPAFQLLSNEGCGRCAACTYPDAPCRFPDRLHHAIEGYGLHISELAKLAGLRYWGGPNTVTYWGGVLLKTPEIPAMSGDSAPKSMPSPPFQAQS